MFFSNQFLAFDELAFEDLSFIRRSGSYKKSATFLWVQNGRPYVENAKWTENAPDWFFKTSDPEVTETILPSRSRNTRMPVPKFLFDKAALENMQELFWVKPSYYMSHPHGE